MLKYIWDDVDVHNAKLYVTDTDNQITRPQFIGAVHYINDEKWKLWFIVGSSFPDDIVEAKNVYGAMWQATLSIYDFCNHMIHIYSKIRDALPSVRELADTYWESLPEDDPESAAYLRKKIEETETNE